MTVTSHIAIVILLHVTSDIDGHGFPKCSIACVLQGYVRNKTLKLFQNYFNDIERVEKYSRAAIGLCVISAILLGRILIHYGLAYFSRRKNNL